MLDRPAFVLQTPLSHSSSAAVCQRRCEAGTAAVVEMPSVSAAAGMHLYSLSLRKATAATEAIYGNFSSPSAHEFVVSRGKALELLRPDEHVWCWHSIRAVLHGGGDDRRCPCVPRCAQAAVSRPSAIAEARCPMLLRLCGRVGAAVARGSKVPRAVPFRLASEPLRQFICGRCLSWRQRQATAAAASVSCAAACTPLPARQAAPLHSPLHSPLPVFQARSRCTLRPQA